MDLHLLRHGVAAEPGTGPWRTDRERPLTDVGIRKMECAARGIAEAGIAFDRILSSPLVRARQTAEIVARAQRDPVEVELTEALAPGVLPEEIFRALRRSRSEASILLVGHEPDMGLLAARLLGLPDERAVRFKKGAIARIQIEALPPGGPGTLVWFLTPRLARSLSGERS